MEDRLGCLPKADRSNSQGQPAMAGEPLPAAPRGYRYPLLHHQCRTSEALQLFPLSGAAPLSYSRFALNLDLIYPKDGYPS
jgi:hypothetical protein